MNIRLAKLADLSSLIQFNQAMAWETEQRQLDNEVLHGGVGRVLSDSNLGFYLVAEEEGVVVAQLMVTYEWSDWRNAIFWWIQSVYVAPTHRRQGLYRALYERVNQLAEGAEETVCGIRLYVEKDNVIAQETYQKLGMAETEYLMYHRVSS